MAHNTTLSPNATGTPFEGVVQNKDWIEVTLEAVFSGGPEPAVIGLLIGGVFMASLYIAPGRDVVLPAIALILTGSALVPVLPMQFRTLAYSLVVVGGAVAGIYAARKYVIQGGLRR